MSGSSGDALGSSRSPRVGGAPTEQRDAVRRLVARKSVLDAQHPEVPSTITNFGCGAASRTEEVNGHGLQPLT